MSYFWQLEDYPLPSAETTAAVKIIQARDRRSLARLILASEADARVQHGTGDEWSKCTAHLTVTPERIEWARGIVG